MTKYQAKRQFINKINQRIRTLTKRAGVDIETILNRVESIDGVYVNDPGTGINIDTSYFTPELENRLNNLIPTYTGVREEAASTITAPESESADDFIGPSSIEARVNQSIRSYFDFEDSFERYKEAFYEWRDAQNSARFEANPKAQAIVKRMSEIGKDWYDEPDYDELFKAARELEQMKY